VCNASLDKDMISLNKKMVGRNIEKFFCINCFAEYFELTVDELLDKIQDFKDSGCSLFS